MRRGLAAIVVMLIILALAYWLWSLGIVGPEEAGKEEAAEIVALYAEGVWNLSQDKEKGLRVNQYPFRLPKGSRVRAAGAEGEENKSESVCQNPSWLFLVDLDPLAHFAHPVRIVLLDAVTREQETIQAQWWPLVDGEPVFDKVQNRTDDETTILYKPPVLESRPTEPQDVLPLGHGGCGPCVEWAVIVCGFDDRSDTFDEDTEGMWSVLRNLGVGDDHIYFVSPHTAHPGVDRATTVANVQWAINQVAGLADGDDRVLFLYSSHGGIDSLCCAPGDPGGGHIGAATLDGWLDEVTCGELCILVEACHSGSLIGRYSDGRHVAAEDELTGDGETNRAIFTSASTDTSSYGDVDGPSDPNPGDSGSETMWGYVEAFGTPLADTDGDDETSFGEAWQYAWDNDVTRIIGENTPQMAHTGLTPMNVYNYCVCRPDLVVDSLAYSPEDPTTMDQIVFTVVVKNIGSGPGGAFRLSIRVGGETEPEYYAVPPLGPGASYTVQRQAVLTVAQRYTVTATVDPDSDLAESDEGNNQESIRVTVSQPIP